MSTEINKDRVILEATDLVRQYTQSDEVITAVDRASMKVYEGEFIAIVGASGSGKSTLLHLLAGMDRPQAGHITIRGQDITAMSADELGRFRGSFIGMVFQSHNLIPQFTALENILIPTLMCNKEDAAYEAPTASAYREYTCFFIMENLNFLRNLGQLRIRRIFLTDS